MMSFTSVKKEELLENVPDLSCWQEARSWIEKGKQLTQKLPLYGAYTCLEGSHFLSTHSEFGYYESKTWRKFVLATFLGDLVSYSNPIDQVNFERLLFVMHAFPMGFRTWWYQIEGCWWPIGYSGWYPMLETQFDLFCTEADKVKNRTVVPSLLNEKTHSLYFFNFSVAPSLKKSALSKNLMHSFAEDIKNQKVKNYACITVSDEGVQIAKRFGMHCTGQLVIDGCVEEIFTTRPNRKLEHPQVDLTLSIP